MKIEKMCEFCRIKFETYPSLKDRKKYCSLECKNKARIGKTSSKKEKTYEEIYGLKRAEEIKKKLSISHKGQHNSPETEFKRGIVPWSTGNDSRKEILCPCGKKFKAYIYSNPKRKYCSRKCFLRYIVGWNAGLTKESDERIATSNKKQTETMKRLYAEGKIKHWSTGLTKETDARIKKGAEKHSRTVKGRKNPKYSETMKRLYATGVYTPWNKNKTGIYSEETIEKIKKARLKQVFPFKDSNPELLLQEALKQQNISFQTHYPVIGQPDIAIFNNKSKIAIFADGCYFHACPIHFDKNNLDKRQKKAIVRDPYVTQELQKQGWTVLRFWEHEINNNLEECKTKIKNYLMAL